MNIVELDAAIRAVCPIDGVSVGRRDDPATWEIQFSASATKQQKTDAQAVLAGVSALDAPSVPTLADQIAALSGSELTKVKDRLK